MTASQRRSALTARPSARTAAVAVPARDSALDADELGAWLLARTLSEGDGPAARVDVDDELAEPESALDWVVDDSSARAIERSLRHLVRLLAHPGASGLLPTGSCQGPTEILANEESAEYRLDLTCASIRDVSLLDYEVEELGQVKSPELRTHDHHCRGTARLARPRG